jgi:hypothetical protein
MREICMHKGWAMKSGPCTATFNDLLYKNLVEEDEGKRVLGKARRMWKETIEIDLKNFGRELAGLIPLSQNRDQWLWTLVNTVMNLTVP